MEGRKVLLQVLGDHSYTASQVAGSYGQPFCKKRRCFSVGSLKVGFQGIHRASPKALCHDEEKMVKTFWRV